MRLSGLSFLKIERWWIGGVTGGKHLLLLKSTMDWGPCFCCYSLRQYRRSQATCSSHLTWWMSFPLKTSRSSEAMCCMTTLMPWQFYPTTTWTKPRDSDSCQWSGSQVRHGKEAEAPLTPTSTFSLLVSRSIGDCLSKSYAMKAHFKSKDLNVVF